MAEQEIFFNEVSRFVAGTIGQPGERAFYLQVRDAKKIFTVAVEKTQVQALAERVAILLRELRITEPLIAIPVLPDDSAPLDLPIDEEFAVGEISISYDAEKENIEIELVEIVENQGDDLTIVRISLTLGQAASFVKRSNSLVAAGRTACPFCGGPINRSGHLCPRANGYRR
jgi:uncharacterized repeat protein (TIGR03847 family)